jgi:transposase
MYVRGIRRLFQFPGYTVEKISVGVGIGQVTMRRDGRARLACPSCGATMAQNRVSTQTARDLPLGLAGVVMLTYPAIQGRCSGCGKTATIHPPGIDPHARATRRLMHFVCRLAQSMPLRDAAELVGIAPATAYRWDFAVLKAGLPPPKLDGLRILLIDEKMVRRRHGYVTLVMNGENGELLYMAEGKKKESLDGFFAMLSDEQAESIVAVAMDRAGAYYEVVKARLPNVEIVFDKFHLVKNYNDVIDKVRRIEWRRAKAADKEVIKGQRYNLFRRPENRTTDQTRSLKALLAINKNLSTVHLLGEQLAQLWTYKSRAWAGRYLDQWIGWARESALAPLHRFARSLARAREEILNYFKHRITTARLEGFNNVVSRIIHRACGVKDLDYLFLKLRQESLNWVPQK